MLQRERHLSNKELIFFDRGTPDSLGYFRHYNLAAEHIIKVCHHLRYKKIFYCHQLPLIEDEIRVEDDCGAKKIGDYIYQAYLNLGYELIELPAVSVEKRLEIIAKHMALPE